MMQRRIKITFTDWSHLVKNQKKKEEKIYLYILGNRWYLKILRKTMRQGEIKNKHAK